MSIYKKKITRLYLILYEIKVLYKKTHVPKSHYVS